MSNEKTDENHGWFWYVIQSTCGFHLCFHWVSKIMHVTNLAIFYWLSNLWTMNESEKRVCKHGCDASLSVFPRHNFKSFQSCCSNSQVQILRNSNEENVSKFCTGDWLSLPLWAGWKKAKERRTTALCTPRCQ